MLTGILKYSHHLLSKAVHKGDIAIDATCGNGHDTLLLSQLVGEKGQVYAFDIQEQAIINSQLLLNEHGFRNVTFIHDSHAHMEKFIPYTLKGHIAGAVFNLGYLPKGNKAVITKGETTLQALNATLSFLKKGGVVVMVVYPGHEGGSIEKEIVLKHVINLDQKEYSVLRYGFINQKNNPPFILAIEKR